MLGHRSYYALFLVPALALSACGGEKPIDETIGAVEEAIPRGGSHFAGTYTGSSRKVGDFSQLVLKTDGTFHAQVVGPCTAPTPCRGVEEDGRYVLYRRQSLTYFEMFETSDGMSTWKMIGRYQYMLDGETLNMRTLGSTLPWTPMVRSPVAWCAVSRDCAVQDLPVGPCAGQYACSTTNACMWQCGAAPVIASEGRKTGSGG